MFYVYINYALCCCGFPSLFVYPIGSFRRLDRGRLCFPVNVQFYQSSVDGAIRGDRFNLGSTLRNSVLESIADRWADVFVLGGRTCTFSIYHVGVAHAEITVRTNQRTKHLSSLHPYSRWRCTQLTLTFIFIILDASS